MDKANVLFFLVAPGATIKTTQENCAWLDPASLSLNVLPDFQSLNNAPAKIFKISHVKTTKWNRYVKSFLPKIDVRKSWFFVPIMPLKSLMVGYAFSLPKGSICIWAIP